jgi:hypothetical protein
MTNINFPDNPSNGDRVGLQVYNATRGVWEWDALPGDTTAQDLLLPGEAIAYSVEYVVIAGGGGAAIGGGGAGGYRSNVLGEPSGGGDPAESLIVRHEEIFSLEVGAGGAGVRNNLGIQGSDGNDTIFGNVVSTGGGGGGTGGSTGAYNAGRNGGSGGGGHAGAAAGLGSDGQGFGGGPNTDNSTGSGGGGAREVGENFNGKGGDGVSSFITGTAVTRAGGGGGHPGGGGGAGGGGTSVASSEKNGVNNTGGGGATNNTDVNAVAAGNGGSGVIILRLSSSATVSFSAGLTEANGGSGQTVGDYKVYTVTAGTGTVTIS